MMRLSTSTNIMLYDSGVNYSTDMETSTRICAEAGYKYIDASISAYCRSGMPLAKDDWQQWAYRMREYGDKLDIRFTQAHSYWPINYTIKPDKTRSDGELGEELMRRSLLTAEILGVDWMVVHPLTVYDGTLYSQAKSLEYNYEYFSRWGEQYSLHNVGMAIENMPFYAHNMRYCSSAEALIELVDSINDPMVGIGLDTGHAPLSGFSVAEFIHTCGSRIKATHIADNHQNKDEHYAPFNGTIDWNKTMKTFCEIRYNNDFSFEIHHLTSFYPASVQEYLVKFSYKLGQYLLSLANT